MQAWLTQDGFQPAQLGFLALVGVPYTFKFLWAPLMDRFEPPWFGRRRGWLAITQALLALGCFALAATPPTWALFAVFAVLLSFFSASQDIVVDAWRTDVLAPRLRGIGGSLAVLGYRVGMVTTGGLALVWADARLGSWTWPQIFQGVGVAFLAFSVFSAFALPAAPGEVPGSKASRDLIGFFAVFSVVVAGALGTMYGVVPLLRWALPTWTTTADLLGLGIGLAVLLPIVWLVAVAAGFETLTRSLRDFFSQGGAAAFLMLLVLYKLGDAFASVLATPFLLVAMSFSQAEVGLVQQVFGLWVTLVGALLGGGIVAWWGLYRSLLAFGVLQLLSNFGFWALARLGAGALGTIAIPEFDALVLAVPPGVSLDVGLVYVVTFENLATGMGTSAVVALMMTLCNQRFSATQYALLSALSAVGRVWVGPAAGVLAENLGWASFFLLSATAALPGLVLLVVLKREVRALDAGTT